MIKKFKFFFKYNFIFTIIFLGLFFLVEAEASLSCSVVDSASCSGVVLLRMSGDVNAHAELPDQNTTVYDNNIVCCTGMAGIGNSCVANNKEVFIKLSSVTNAHVELPTENTYSQNACLSSSFAGDVITVGSKLNNCEGYDTTLFSIARTPTNSQVGNTTAYANKICAKVVSQSISFSLSDNNIGFGNLIPTGLRYATGDGQGSSSETESYNIKVSTNAPSGYGLYVRGSSLKKDSVVIDPIGGVSIIPNPGSKAFGIKAVVSGGSGQAVAPYNGSGFAYNADSSSPTLVGQASFGDGQTTTYSIRTVATIDSLLDPGNYSTELIYVLTANF